MGNATTLASGRHFVELIDAAVEQLIAGQHLPSKIAREGAVLPPSGSASEDADTTPDRLTAHYFVAHAIRHSAPR